jgi:hypothetical protein
MSVGIPVHDGTYKTWAERAAYFEQLRAKVAEVPGVTMAAISTNATPPANGNSTFFQISGKPSQQDQPTRLNFVSREYFPALRISLAQGRIWNQDEDHRGAAFVTSIRPSREGIFPTGTPSATPSRSQISATNRPTRSLPPAAKVGCSSWC